MKHRNDVLELVRAQVEFSREFFSDLELNSFDFIVDVLQTEPEAMGYTHTITVIHGKMMRESNPLRASAFAAALSALHYFRARVEVGPSDESE